MELGLTDKEVEAAPGAEKLTPTVRKQFAAILDQVDLLHATLGKQLEQRGRR